MGSPLIFLAGQSYPRDDHVEGALCKRLRSHFEPWLGQKELVDLAEPSVFDPRVSHRLRGLEAVATSDALLVGRSSGARVVTQYAARARVQGVVCLGYPFRAPRLTLEIKRFGHLETLGVPTLIIQGEADAYGGAEITRNYSLSASVSVRLIRADHELNLSSAAWDHVAALILDFHARIASGSPPAPERFDEDAYLRDYPDVAAAVTAGQFDTGSEHFQTHGRGEKRMYGVLIEPWP